MQDLSKILSLFYTEDLRIDRYERTVDSSTVTGYNRTLVPGDILRGSVINFSGGRKDEKRDAGNYVGIAVSFYFEGFPEILEDDIIHRIDFSENYQVKEIYFRRTGQFTKVVAVRVENLGERVVS